MPRLPSADDLGPAGSLASQRGLASYDLSPLSRGEAAIGAGIQKIGDAGLGVGLDLIAKDRREGAVFDKARADAAFIPAHTDLLLKQQDEPDADAYQKGSQDALREAASNIRDPQARELWLLNHASTLASGKATVKGLTDKRDADHTLASIRTDEDRSLHTIVNAPNPADATAMVRAVATRYDEAAAKGYITEVQALAFKKALALRSATARIGSLDPEDQVAAWKGPVTGRDGVIDRIIGVESNGDAAAQNPSSTATGLGQFTEGTWLGTVKAHRPDLLQGRSTQQVLALRKDAGLSREMTGYLVDDNGKALAAQGLPQNPTTLYLSHFLGSGGAAAVLKAKPGTPVSDVLDDDQIAANRSILAGKTVDSVVGWAGRKMGHTSEGDLASALPEDVREVGLRQAEALYERDLRRRQQASAVDTATVKSLLKDDEASIMTTGQPVAELTTQRVKDALGPAAAAQFEDNRKQAVAYHHQTSDWDQIPVEEIRGRLAALQPTPGSAGYDSASQYVQAAQKRAAAIVKERSTDPAAAADRTPEVRAALEGASLDRPETYQAVAKARAVAQDKLKIPEDLRVPMTRGEAQQVARPLELAAQGGDPREMKDMLTETVKQLQTAFGDDSDTALQQVIKEAHIGRAASEQVAIVLKKLARNEQPTPQDMRAIDEAQKTAGADRAVAGITAASPAAEPIDTSVQVDPETGRPVAEIGGSARAPTFPTPDADAIKMLRGKPELARAYDKTYGPGAAQKVLELTGARP